MYDYGKAEARLAEIPPRNLNMDCFFLPGIVSLDQFGNS